VKGFFKQQTLKPSKLVKLDKVLHKWFTATCSEGNRVTGPMIIEKAKKMADKCTFPVGWLQNLGTL
jgi:hypothetical protein